MSGGAQALGGSVRAISSISHRHNLKKDMENLRKHSDLLERTEVASNAEKQAGLQTNAELLKTADQARRMEQVRLFEGSMETISGGLLALGNAADLTGIGAPVGIGAKLGALITIITKGAIAKKIRNRKRKNIVEEELGLKEKMRALRASGAAKDDREAKRLALKSMGFASGKRREAFAKITMKRAAALHEAAQTGNNHATNIIKHMGIHKTGSGYSLQAIAEKMGMDSTTDWQSQLQSSEPVNSGRPINPFVRPQPNPPAEEVALLDAADETTEAAEAVEEAAKPAKRKLRQQG
ncbi:MAG: hypothetical protein IKL99_04350 [Oscillospiraceae bacterium]|nr:hypothetical protein [Oscillospiraceae bacterium]